MFKITDEKELIGSFRASEQEEVILPPEIRFPILVKDYLSWLEPSGNRVYLVFRDGESRLGIVFRRDQGAGTSAVMCEWCHSVRGGDSVGLLTAKAAANRRVGIHLCRDLSCKDKLEVAPGIHDLQESVEPRERARRILGRISVFARRELF